MYELIKVVFLRTFLNIKRIEPLRHEALRLKQNFKSLMKLRWKKKSHILTLCPKKSLIVAEIGKKQYLFCDNRI